MHILVVLLLSTLLIDVALLVILLGDLNRRNRSCISSALQRGKFGISLLTLDIGHNSSIDNIIFSKFLDIVKSRVSRNIMSS